MRVDTSDVIQPKIPKCSKIQRGSGEILKYFNGKINGLLNASNTVKAAAGGHRVACTVLVCRCLLACVCLCAMCAVPVEAGRGYLPLKLESHIVVSYGVGAWNLK